MQTESNRRKISENLSCGSFPDILFVAFLTRHFSEGISLAVSLADASGCDVLSIWSTELVHETVVKRQL